MAGSGGETVAFIVGTVVVSLSIGRAVRAPVPPVERGAMLAALFLAVLPAVVLAVAPLYSSSPPQPWTARSLWGQGNAAGLAVPMVLAAVPFWFGRSRALRERVEWVCAVVLTVLTVLGSFTVGLYFLPAAAGLWASAIANRGAA